MAQNATKPDVQAQIAVLAYNFWKERGSPNGTPEIDWLKAEQELKTTTKTRSTRSKTVSTPRTKNYPTAKRARATAV